MYQLIRYAGYRLRKGLTTTLIPKTVRKPYVKSFQRSNANVVLVSFPKCGRTWLRMLIGKTLQQMHPRIPDRKLLRLSELYYYHSDIPRFWITHNSPKKHLQSNDWIEKTYDTFQSKQIIYLIRHPLDVMVSYFHQLKNRKKSFQGNMDDFIDNRNKSINLIITFYNNWIKLIDEIDHTLVLSYEDLQYDAFQALKELFSFIDCPLGIPSADILQGAVDYSKFDNMRRLESSQKYEDQILNPGDQNNKNSFKTRKGKTGSHREELNERQLNTVRKIVANQLHSFYFKRLPLKRINRKPGSEN